MRGVRSTCRPHARPGDDAPDSLAQRESGRAPPYQRQAVPKFFATAAQVRPIEGVGQRALKRRHAHLKAETVEGRNVTLRHEA